MNDNLLSWLHEQGIEAQITARYSPAQNGAAEPLNCTLVELAHAMMIAHALPTYLWEYALLHAVNVREQTPTKALPGKTPYEAWNGTKPNVAHLHKFGTPVYMLVQGQKDRPKLLPKSKPYMFLGYENGSSSVKNYNVETHRVHTSRNFKFLKNLPIWAKNLEPIIVDPPPALLCEGECLNRDTLQTGSKRQYEGLQEDEPTMLEPPQRKLQTQAPVNYHYLNDPFPDEGDNEDTHLTFITAIYNAVLGSDDPKTMKEAKGLEDWAEWEKAIRVELDQLEDFRTWKLVNCPQDAVPLPNKWVFVKKYNKYGELIKYKARLVVKGCAQRPGFDYTETFSPVVWLETIRAILSIVPSQDLMTHQLDVKGAYLNSTLNEKVYMYQPDGYNDGTGRVCLLKKTLYGLKQSRCEWNRELDRRLKEKDFTNLLSDSCAYICRDGSDVIIITI